MYSYHAFNLTISSEFPLSGLARVEKPPDVVVRLQRLHNIDPDSLDPKQYVLGKLPDIGFFLIKEGREIAIDPAGIDESTLAPSILGPAMSVILRQRGYLVLHASCVAINEGRITSDRPQFPRQQATAIAFLGASGSGKSTLAETFHTQGYKVLTDDVMAIRFDQGYPYVIPSFPQCKLTAQAATALGLKYDQMPVLLTHAGKRSYVFKHGFQETPLRLQKIYVLTKGSHHEVISLSRQAAFAELVRHTRAVNIMTASDQVTSHLQQCTNLLKAVPVSQFTRRPSLAELPALVNLVQADLASANQQRLRSQTVPEPSCFSA